MTNSREFARIINRSIHQVTDQKSDIFDEGVVVDISRKSKMVQVQIYPNKTKVWCRILFPMVAKDVWSGGMPVKGARCLLAKLSKIDDVYEDCVIIGFLHDERENTENADNKSDNNDPNYYCIEPLNGGKIEFYKDSNNKQQLKITGVGDVNLIVENGVVNVVNNGISLGEADLGDNNKIVLSPHLDKHNDFINAVTSWINLATPTLIAAGAFVGAVFSPTATPEYLTNSNLAKDTTNKTSKVKAT